MGWYLFPLTWHPGEPEWRAVNESAAVSVNTLQDVNVSRTSGWCVVAQTTQLGGSIAIDFKWPFQEILIGTEVSGFMPPVITMATWIRTRPGQILNGTLTFWDVTKNLSDTVQFTATEIWQAISLSAALLPQSADDVYRVEIYMNSANVNLLVDRTVVV